MPPAKKAKKGAAASKSPNASKSPKDEYFDRLKAACDANNCKGSCLIAGIEADSEDGSDFDDDENDDEKEYTAEEIAQLRHVLINDSRDAAIEKAMNFATGGQLEDGFMMFSTSTGNDVVLGMPDEIRKATATKKNVSERFDALFALTYALKEYDHWMHDNEFWEDDGPTDKAIKQLARAWKKLLKSSNEELGIDAEFSRPGVEAMLDQFKQAVGPQLPDTNYTFNWN